MNPKHLLPLLVVIIVAITNISCEKENYVVDNAEMVWIEFDKPNQYNYFDQAFPSQSWETFKCMGDSQEVGPFNVDINANTKTIEIQTFKQIKEAFHITGSVYDGQESIPMEIDDSGTSFKVYVETPDLYGEVFRIWYE